MLMETRIISIQLDQLVMLAFLDDLSFLDNQNPVRGPHGTEPMRDDEDGAALANLREVALDNGFGLVIEGTGRLIKDQHAGIRDQGARDCNPLPLPAGQRAAMLPDLRVVSIGQLQNELMRTG